MGIILNWLSYISLVDGIVEGLCGLVLDPLKWNILSSVFLWIICYCFLWPCSFWLSPLVSDTPSASVRAYCLTLHNAAIQSLRIFFSVSAFFFFPLLPELRGVYHRAGWVSIASNVDAGNPTYLPSPLGCEQSGGLVCHSFAAVELKECCMACWKSLSSFEWGVYEGVYRELRVF